MVATYDPVAWAALLGQLAVLALWGVAWSFRISDFEHDESRWNRAFVAGEHRRDTEWTERRQEMGPRWAELERARMEKADPFTEEDPP